MKALPILALILLVLGGVGYFMFGQDEGKTSTAPDLGGLGLTDGTEKAVDDTGGALSIDDKQGQRGGDTESEDVRRTTPERSSYPQGIEGILASSQGGVLRDAPIYLIEGVSAKNMLQILVNMAGGSKVPAKVVAQGRTDNNGIFRIDSPVTPPDAPYELRIAADGHLHYKKPLRVLANRWEKLGTITVEKGRLLEGTVRDAETKQPIVGAILRVMPPELNAMQPTPGLEDGYEAQTDKVGRYRLEGLPAGPFQLTAFAKGYGSVVKSDVTIASTGAAHREDLELPKGFEISGYVVDASGNGVARARVEATPLASASPTPGSTFTDKDGAFHIYGLTDGQFIVSALATGYSKNEVKPVKAGTLDLSIPVEKQGAVLVAVKSRAGRPVQTFTAQIRRFFPENPEHYGNTDLSPVQARSKTGEARIEGLDPGHYVVQVDASGYAKTFSKNFEMREGTREEVRVDVTLNEGGALFGTVVDSTGKPVAGATVESLAADYQDNPIVNIFSQLQPKRITESSRSTDSEGRFRLEKLTPASYQLRVSHPNYARGYFKGFDVTEGEKKNIGRLQLKAGVTVRGRCRVGAGVGVGVEITLSRTKELNGDASEIPVYEKLFSNEKGEWQSTRKLPEGIYEVQGSRVDLPNPLMKIVDIQQSKREVRVMRGMPLVLVTIPDSK